jgi:hypothetical protein
MMHNLSERTHAQTAARDPGLLARPAGGAAEKCVLSPEVEVGLTFSRY